MTNGIGQILITGASRGIGRAIAVRLAKNGRRFILHGRNREALGETARLVEAAGAQAIEVAADLAGESGVKTLARSVTGQIDVIVNSAGIAIVKPLEEHSLDEWQATLDINVTAPFLLLKELIARIPSGGSIVNVLSVAAKTGFPTWSSYCMSKFAMDGFSQALREELRPKGIRVINVYPGATNTKLWNSVPGEWDRAKMLDPNEVAEAIAYALDRPSSVAIESISVGNIAGTL